MNRTIKYLLLFATALVAQTGRAQTAGKGIKFFDGTLKEALALAQKQNKPVFVDFYAVWCVPCKRMAKQVFTIDSVGDYFNERFVSVQVDAEKADDVAKQYNVQAFPTLGFLKPDGKAISITVGAMDAAALMEAARVAAGEAEGFEQLYAQYKADDANLDTQRRLLLKAPTFLAAQEGMEAEKWVTRITRIYNKYIAAKMGPALINKDDYLIMYNLGGGSRDDKLRIIDFISANLDAWVKVVGKPAAYYVVEGNDDIMEQMAKDGDAKYAERVEKVRTDYKAAYDMVGTDAIAPYDRAKLYADAIYHLYKSKDVPRYVTAMTTLFQKLGDKARPADYGKAAQQLYYAAGSKLTPAQHRQAIEWVERALKDEKVVMSRVNYLVMLGDSHRELKEYAKAREYYNQGYAESLQMANMEDAQALVQMTIQRKLSALELLEK